MIVTILTIVACNFVGMVCLLYILVRRMDRKLLAALNARDGKDLETILDAIDDSRDTRDTQEMANALEHKSIESSLKRIIGQNQFIMADKIWAQKESIKQERLEKMAAEAKKLAEDPHNDG